MRSRITDRSGSALRAVFLLLLSFGVGAAVRIVGIDGKKIARGLVNYSSEDILRIKGRKSQEIQAILGRKDFDEVVHRDNLVML